jgi:hypothetical protein
MAEISPRKSTTLRRAGREDFEKEHFKETGFEGLKRFAAVPGTVGKNVCGTVLLLLLRKDQRKRKASSNSRHGGKVENRGSSLLSFV